MQWCVFEIFICYIITATKQRRIKVESKTRSDVCKFTEGHLSKIKTLLGFLSGGTVQRLLVKNYSSDLVLLNSLICHFPKIRTWTIVKKIYTLQNKMKKNSPNR